MKSEKRLPRFSVSSSLSRASISRRASSITDEGELGNVGSRFSLYVNGVGVVASGIVAVLKKDGDSKAASSSAAIYEKVFDEYSSLALVSSGCVSTVRGLLHDKCSMDFMFNARRS